MQATTWAGILALMLAATPLAVMTLTGIRRETIHVAAIPTPVSGTAAAIRATCTKPPP